jgi:hypothetical protein
MKKTIVVLVLISICGALFAATLSTKAQNEINAIKTKASGLSNAEKQAIMENNEKGLTGPLLLNIFLGAGIGSFVEGDTTGGLIALAGEGVGIGLISYGYISLLQQVMQNAAYGSGNPVRPEEIMDKAVTVYGGVLIWAGFRVYSVIRAISYTKEYNRRLADALGAVKIGVVPVFDNDGAKLALAAKVSF